MIRLAVCVLILVAAAGSPWLFGGYSPWCYALAPLIVFLAGLLWLAPRVDRGVSGWSWASVAMGGLLLGYVWFQTVPLPPALLGVLVPKARLERLDALRAPVTECAAETDAAPPSPWNRISTDPPETRRQWVILATAFAVALIAMALASDELCRLVMVFLLAINGAAFGVLALFMRAASPGLIYWTVKPRWGGMPFGAFVNRNHAGLFLALSGLCALFGICLLLSQRIVRRAPSYDDDGVGPRGGAVSLTDLRMIWLSQKDSVLFSLAFCALFCAVSSIVAASRSGALAFGAVVVVSALMLFVSGADRRLILAIGILGGIAAIVSGAKFDYLIERFESENIERGWLGRMAHWSDVLDQANEYAVAGLGHGSYAYSTLPYISNANPFWFQHADNQFVETFVELGVIGSLLVLAAVVFFGVRCAMLIRSGDLQARIVGLFGCGLIAICAINALGDFALAMPGVILPMMLAAGFVLGYRPAPATIQKTSPSDVGVNVALKFATVAALAWATAIGVANFSDSRHPIDRNENFAQWLARTVSQQIGEPSLTALANDAKQEAEQFVTPARGAIEAIDPELFQDNAYPLETLAMFKRVTEVEDLDPDFYELRDALRAAAPLESARRIYREASLLAPMRFENHLESAKLDLFLCPGEGVRKQVERVRMINRSSGPDAGRTGVVCVVNGDIELGGELLGQALRQSPSLERNIFTVLKSQMTVQQVAKYVLGADAPLIIRAADRYYGGKNEWLARNFLYAHLQQAIERGDVIGLTEPEKKYYLAKSKRMSGDFEGAFADFEEAIKDWNAPLAWHKELASFYMERGRLTDARRTLVRIQREFAYDASVEKQIENIDKRLRAKRP